jgi:hypothetical protein
MEFDTYFKNISNHLVKNSLAPRYLERSRKLILLLLEEMTIDFYQISNRFVSFRNIFVYKLIIHNESSSVSMAMIS